MENINVIINKKTRQVNLSKSVIGTDGENLQEKFIFSFDDEFVDGTARIELIKSNTKTYIMLTKVNETYELPIKSVITKGGKIDMQLVITEGTNDEDIPVFKSKIFYVVVNSSINAIDEEPSGYEQWIDIADTKLNEIDNIDIEAEQTQSGATVTVTKKNGTEESVILTNGSNGVDGTDGVDGFSPIATVTKNRGGSATISITDKNGTTTATVNDGQDGQPGQNGITPTIGNNGNWYLGTTDTGKPSRGIQGQTGNPGSNGQDGYSPTVTTSKSGKITTITITDKNGSHVSTINDGQDGTNGQNGQDGQDGYSPTATVSQSGDITTISITDKNGTTTATINSGGDEDTKELVDEEFLATTEGTNINTYSTYNEKVNRFELEKVSTQDGTPSPSSPKAISMITSDVGVKIIGKNLFNNDILVNKDFDTGTGALLGYNAKILINNDFIVLPNGTYTLTLGYVNQVWILNYDQNGNFLYGTSSWQTDEHIIFSVTDNHKLRFGFNRTISGTRQDISKENVTVQIESGDQGTSYTAYTESNITVPIGNNFLAGIGTDLDELIVDKTGKVYINKKIDKIDSYNGETITTSYMSTTGSLTTGATVIYVKSEPELINLNSTVDMTLYEGVNTFSNNKSANMRVTCYHNIKKTYELKSNKTTTLSETSTNNEYPTAKTVFNEISTKFNSYSNAIANDSPIQFYRLNVGLYTFQRGGSSLASYQTNYNYIYINTYSGGSFTYINGFPILLNYYSKVENKTYSSKYYFASLLFFDNSNGALNVANFYKSANSSTISIETGSATSYWPYAVTNSTQTFYGTKSFYTIPQLAYNSTPTYDTQLTPKKYVDEKITTYTGYDASKTQVLKNVNGTITWVDE